MLRLAVGLFFIVVPVLELVLLVKTGQAIGVWATLGLVVAAAIAGAAVISRQSSTLVQRTLEAMSAGHVPAADVLDGLFLVVAGLLLLTPGLLTDVLAVLLMVPPLRRVIARWSIRAILQRGDAEGDDESRSHSPAGQSRHRSAQDGPIIEGEFERLSEKPVRPARDNNRHPA